MDGSPSLPQVESLQRGEAHSVPMHNSLGPDDGYGVKNARKATIEPNDQGAVGPTQLQSAWCALLQDIELMPQYQDFGFQPLPRLEAIAQHADEVLQHQLEGAAGPSRRARRLVERFEWHYSPKHGSWLNIAESELGVLSNQSLDRRIPDQATLIKEIAAWEKDRNKHHAKAGWQFTTADARIKLKYL